MKSLKIKNMNVSFAGMILCSLLNFVKSFWLWGRATSICLIRITFSKDIHLSMFLTLFSHKLLRPYPILFVALVLLVI